jgi:ankyrin repeat protein
MINESENALFGNLVFSGKLEKVQELIDSGVNLDQIGSNGLTPLIMAIEGDQPKILELLLEKGANPNKPSKLDGFTPLHWAVDYAIDGMVQNDRSAPYPEPLECIRILLKYGADIKIKDYSGKTVLDFPITKEISRALLIK